MLSVLLLREPKEETKQGLKEAPSFSNIMNFNCFNFSAFHGFSLRAETVAAG